MFIAIYKDPQEMPRAWARSIDRIQAEAYAYVELQEYKDEKRTVGDPLADATFTLEIWRSSPDTLEVVTD